MEEKEQPKKLKMRKSWRGTFKSPTGFLLTEIYCRRCVQYKNPKDFQISKDFFLDKNGMMSICKSCCEEIYQDNLRSERDIRKAMLKTCRTLNWVYFDGAVNGATEKVKNSENDIAFTPTYWGLVQAASNLGDKTNLGSVLTFTEPIVTDFTPKELIDDNEIDPDIIDFWGEGFTPEEYIILQRNYLDFKRDYKVEVKGEIFIVREICFKILDIEKNRQKGGNDAILKDIQTLMKNGALTPAMANMANSGQAKDTWGVRIATIQKEEPAEWLEGEEQRNKYLNYGDLKYFKDYYVRSLKNFILGSKDYTIDGDVQPEDDDEFIIEELTIEEGEQDAHKEES